MKTFNRIYYYSYILKGAMYYDYSVNRYFVTYINKPITGHLELIIDYRP